MELSKNAQFIIYAHERGYRVQEDGSVVSGRGRLLKLFCRSGYLAFAIQNRARSLKGRIPVHRMHAYQIFGDIIFQKGVQVRHLSGDKEDNTKLNLAIGTASQNSMDRSGDERLTQSLRAASKKRKLSAEMLDSFRRDREEGMSLSRLARKYGISKTAASYIVNGKTYVYEKV